MNDNDTCKIFKTLKTHYVTVIYLLIFFSSRGTFLEQTKCPNNVSV